MLDCLARLSSEEFLFKLSKYEGKKEEVPRWSVNDVLDWIKSIGFERYSHSFLECRVDGDILFQIVEKDVQRDLKITNGIHRKRFMRELRALKRNSDFGHEGSEIKSFLERAGPGEFEEYVYGFIRSGVRPSYLLDIKNEVDLKDVLKECGVDKSAHRLRIVEYVRKTVERKEVFQETAIVQKEDIIYVVYKKSCIMSRELADLIEIRLRVRGLVSFALPLEKLAEENSYVFISTEPEDIHRIGNKNNVVPVIHPELFHGERNFHGVSWVHDYQEACIDRILNLLRHVDYSNDSGICSREQSPMLPSPTIARARKSSVFKSQKN